MTTMRPTKILKLANWPASDRARWDAMFTDDDPLAKPGPAAHWRDATRRMRAKAWGRLLAFLGTSDQRIASRPIEERLTPQSIEAFDRHLAATVGLCTRWMTLRDIAIVFEHASGEPAPALLRRLARMHGRKFKRARRRRPTAKLGALRDLGDTLMARAESVAAGGQPRIRHAILFRDGLLIRILADRPLRRGNLAMIRCATHMKEFGDRLFFSFASHEMKQGRAYRTELSADAARRLGRYLAFWRPILLRGRGSDRLWIGLRSSGTLSAHGIAIMIAERTKLALGSAVWPHEFRRAAATFLVQMTPNEYDSASDLLGHKGTDMLDRAYNRAPMEQAVAVFDRIKNKRARRLAALVDAPQALER